jgi:hypothetical protein
MNDSVADVSTLTTEQLEDGMRRLAAQLAAGVCDFLVLLAEFDRRGGWGGWGLRSAAHWLSLHCGMRLGAARERVRVAHALPHLPLVRQAFSEGRLSYCKVRALTRVATPVTEPELVEVALAATGAQLERVVRQWRTTLVAEMSASSQLRRGLRRREEIDGSVVYTLRVPPEDAAAMDVAIEAARRVVLDDAGRPVETPEETSLAAQLTDEPPIVRAGADAFVVLAESFLAAGAVGRAKVEVVVHADVDALPDVTSDITPELKPDVTSGAGPDVESPSESAREPDGASLAQRVAVRRPPGARTDSGAPLAPATVLRLLCNASTRVMVSAKGNPLHLGRSVRHASHRQRRALHTRDSCCRFPGCTQTKRLIPHHVWWWSRGGLTDLDNLLLICPAHHRAVHEVGYTIATFGDGRFAFYRPDGVRLPETAPPVDVGRVSPPLHSVDSHTISPIWAGERLDIDMLVQALAANTINASGRDLSTVAHDELSAALREAAQWPLVTRSPRAGSLTAA